MLRPLLRRPDFAPELLPADGMVPVKRDPEEVFIMLVYFPMLITLFHVCVFLGTLLFFFPCSFLDLLCDWVQFSDEEEEVKENREEKEAVVKERTLEQLARDKWACEMRLKFCLPAMIIPETGAINRE